ncbi:MAG TPA: FAD-dependent oxidoreductase [Terracidiphilus sp.]|jgi:NADPH-dependent glutamate synthase beta subunit-like oxidoreductase|nr:FAD-dependent oxidoreductase [Terracidiphilus sp.]
MSYAVTIPDREYFDKNIPCQTACPIHTECGRYVQAIGLSKDEEAYMIARAPNPFAYVLGRICAHPCEDNCRRGKIDEPIAICALKRYATDRHNLGAGHDPARRALPPVPKRDKRIAVVGAGVCGLTCAHDLALLGYAVEVFESAPVPGGMLYLGIPHFRLPREIIKMEVENILSMGVKLRTRVTIGRDISFTDLRAKFDAVLLATGLNKGRDLKIPGAHLSGVCNGIDFLINVNLGFEIDLGRRVAVVGGGNVAIDVARSAVRLVHEVSDLAALDEEQKSLQPAFDVARMARRSGAEQVALVSLESRAQMPAWKGEVEEAEHEGIVVDNGWGPMEIIGENGAVTGLKVRRCVSVFDENGRFNPAFSDEEKIIPCDSVILAIGQQADLSYINTQDGVQVTPRGILKINEDMSTTAPGVFAGGDVAFGPRVLVEAVANGHRAARSIHVYLSGKTAATVRSRFRILPNWKMPKAYLTTPRQIMPVLPANRRIGIAEVELGFSDEQGRKEGMRCLNCQVNTIFDGSKCILCAGCVDVCPESCLRLVDLAQVSGDARYDALIQQRYGVPAALLKGGRAGAIIKNEEKCIRCGLCADRCPTGAITMEALERQVREVFD